MRILKLVLATIIATSIMALAAQSSPAYVFTASPAGSFTLASGSITFTTAIATARCPLTLDGTLDAGPTSFAAGSQFGTITRATIGTCTGGPTAALVGGGWPLTVAAVPAGLPDNATQLTAEIAGFSFQTTMTVLGINVVCLFQGPLDATIALTDTGTNTYSTSSVTLLSSPAIPKFSGAGSCPTRGTFAGTLSLSPIQTMTVS